MNSVAKKLILALAALPIATYASAAPAQNAQGSGGAGVQARIANLEARYNAGLRAGVFNSAERTTLNRQLTDLRNLERSYSSNGISLNERRALQQRIRTIREQLRSAGGTGWANGYGWSDDEQDTYAGARDGGVTYDAYGRPVQNTAPTYDRYGRPIATNGVVYDQYGRPIDGGTYGQSGSYEPARQGSGMGNVLGGVLGSVVGARSGAGGVLGSVLGGGSGMGGILGSVLSRGGLRTGEVITGALGSVLGSAAGIGSQYRDNNNVYYRSDGQRVYEIDARTNTVARVIPVQR